MLAHLFLYITVHITAINDRFRSSLIFIDFQFEFHLQVCMDEITII